MIHSTITSITLTLCILCQFASANSIPVEYFGQLPDVTKMELSPKGNKLAYLVRVDLSDIKGIAVEITDLNTQKKKQVLFSDNSRYFISAIEWKDNQTLLVYTYYPDERDTWLGMGQARYDTREGRLLIINTITGEVKSPFSKGFLKRFTVLPSWLSEVVDILENDPDHILMALPDYTLGKYNNIYKINIHNQRKSLIQGAQTNISSWETDKQGRIRIGNYSKDGSYKTLVKAVDSDEWIELWPHELYSEDEKYSIGFDYDPNILYYSAYNEGFKAIFKVDLRDPKLSPIKVYAEPGRDVSGYLIYSEKDKRAIGLTSSPEGGTFFFDKSWQALQEMVDNALPKTKNYIYSFSQDMEKFLVYSTSDIESGTFYLGQRSPAQLHAVAYRYKNLTPMVSAPVKPFTYKARDGLTISAWLTIPKEVKNKPLPAVIYPHGGPHSRDTDAYDYWAQFFASKGYAVLQMNFRGSTGSGIEFRNAGLKNWGQEMQDDIEDGVRELIKNGVIDKDRVAIVGASYGGYAALMGAVKTPDVYKCAISINGVSDVFELVRNHRAFWRGFNIIEEQIGEYSGKLKAISPINFPEKISIPILLVHGERDRQVEVMHSRGMYKVLSELKKDVTYIELPNEDHYLSNEINRMTTFRAMDQFLARCLD